ncbi:MAG: ABC transporter ATP-binding protein [Nitrososphaerota archaeon]|nr:ABC transporter ATP-binding protein [Nitrososphaerota archaeon]
MSLDVDRGEFLSIVGPSGCGKSTLLRIIAGLEKPTSGHVLIDGQKVTGPARTKGFIFQAVGLYPWRNTVQNVEFYLEINGVPKKERRRIAEEKLALVGLSEFANFPPVQLSGGMQQKVAIARALTVEPSILLMDEPFGALDALSRERSQADLLQILSKDKERSIIFVTHGIDEAVFLSDKVVVFSPRPGKIKQTLNVELGGARWSRDIRSTSKFNEYCNEVRRTLMAGMPA